jgi:hypothetical protein
MKHIVQEIADECQKERQKVKLTREQAMLELSMITGEIHRCYLNLQYGDAVKNCRVLETEMDLRKHQMQLAVLNMRMLAGDFV